MGVYLTWEKRLMLEFVIPPFQRTCIYVPNSRSDLVAGKLVHGGDRKALKVRLLRGRKRDSITTNRQGSKCVMNMSGNDRHVCFLQTGMWDLTRALCCSVEFISSIDRDSCKAEKSSTCFWRDQIVCPFQYYVQIKADIMLRRMWRLWSEGSRCYSKGRC